MRPDAMRPRPKRVRPKLNDLASMPHGPRGLNIPGIMMPELFTLCLNCKMFYGLPVMLFDLFNRFKAFTILTVTCRFAMTVIGSTTKKIAKEHCYR